MTIESTYIEDFKCFKQLELSFTPLTLLTGFNAAGKSTALQSMLLISQHLRSSTQGKFLALNGPLVRLGSGGDVLRRGGAGRIRFRIQSDGEPSTWELIPAEDDGSVHEHRERLKLVSSGEGDTSNNLQALKSVRDLIYLGATRHERQDVFSAPDEADPVNGDVGSDGRFAPWWYVRNADDHVDQSRRLPGSEGETFRSQVDAWLEFLFPGVSVNAKKAADTGYTVLEFKTSRASAWSRPANVGFGLSYAFPLVVALLAAREGQVLVVDSPEAHLHPRAQSNMGKLLAAFAMAGVQILVETHSDHILSGVRLAVKNQILRSTDMSVHFFTGAQEDGATGVVSPSISSDGNLSDWPQGFFDQGEIDLFALSAI